MAAMAGSQSIPSIPKPLLTWSPPYSEFAQRERVSLQCSPPEGWRGGFFYFYSTNSHGQYVEYTRQKENTLEVSTKNLKSKEPFACSYVIENSFHSPKSNPVVFSVTESPPPEMISLDPQRSVYIRGEEVTLNCLAPEGKKVTGYTFLKEQLGQAPEQMSLKECRALFHVGENTAGKYSCTYWITSQEGNEFQSLQSNIISITVREPPPSATLSLDPQHPFYIQGEEVTLKCAAPESWKVTRYTFSKERQGQGPKQLLHIGNELYKIFHVGKDTAGEYSCTYWISLHEGNELHSLESNTISIAVTEIPAAPTPAVSPLHPVYLQGEWVTLTCSAPGGLNVTGYKFYKGQQDPWCMNLTCAVTVTTETFEVDEKTAGNYSCAYWLFLSGREIQSNQSSFVSVALADLSSAPLLKVDPPSGVLSEGEPLLITCLANGSYTKKRFHFYKNGVEITSRTEGSLRSSRKLTNASVSFLQSKPNHTGEFACRYEEKMRSRWIMSPWSQKVNITVSSVSPKSSLVYACLAIPLLIVMVPLGFYCWRKKNAAKVRQGSEPAELKEEMLDPQAKALKAQGSDVTYALIPATSSGPVIESRIQPMKEERVLYSEVRIPSITGAK